MAFLVRESESFGEGEEKFAKNLLRIHRVQKVIQNENDEVFI